MDLSKLLENAFYLLALLNPASKIMFLSTYNPPLERHQIMELAWKSSAAALLILIVLSSLGEMILSNIFRVEMYSLRITGGLVVFFIGLKAIREGHFTGKPDEESQSSFTDISLVPLAAPLIAGPGTIAAAIGSTAEVGILSTSISLFIAIFINFVLMLFSPGINYVLTKTHLLGPLVRVTGMIISAVSVQMIATGLREFCHSI